MAINFSQVTHIEIPKYPYHQIDYIKFNGTDNYMDLDRQVDLPAYSTRGTQLEFELDSVSSGYIMGVFEPHTRPAPDRFFYIYLNNGKLYVHFQDYYYNYEYDEYEKTEVQDEMCSVSTNTRYKLTFNSTTSGTRTINVKQGNTTLYSTEDGHNFPYDLTPAFMARKTIQGGQNTYDGFARCRLYGFVSSAGTVGTTDYYYPIYNDSTQTLGIYNDTDDTEIPSRYYMQGTTNAQSRGDFTNPQTITLPTTEVKQITNSNNVVLWRDVRLVSIAISNATTSLPINTSFSFGGTVTATYSDGSTANVTASTIFSGYNMSTSGTQTVTATYTEVGITKTATYSLEVVAVSSIALSGQTTSLPVGGTFSFGGTVTATYTNGTTADVTNSTTFSGYDMSTGGTYTVTASYTENNVTVTTTYQLTVASEVTISYKKCIYQSSAPASKTVTAGYALTSADLPTSSSGDWSVIGWTIDGTNAVSAGYVVNGDIELCAIQKYTHTSSSLFKSAKNSAYEKTVTISVSNGAVGNSNSGTTMTYTNSKSYTSGNPGYDTFVYAQIGSWGGLVGTIDLEHAARIEWTPSRSTVTFSSSLSSGTNVYNYGGTYPTLVLRHVGTQNLIYSKTQNNANKITYDAPEPNSGSKVRVYIQHGGNDGGQKLASRADYRNTGNTSVSYGITCNASTATETVYFYTTPSN